MQSARFSPRAAPLRTRDGTLTIPPHSAWAFGRGRLWPLVALGAALLAAVAVGGPSMNVLPWIGVIVIASMAGLFALQSILRAADGTDTFAAGAPLPGERSGELVAFGQVLARARSGYVYSHAIAAARVAVAFLEKVRLSRGLSPSEMERVRGDRQALLDLIGDPELADFVYEHGRQSGDWTMRGGAAMARKPHGPAFSNVLEAMEAWS